MFAAYFFVAAMMWAAEPFSALTVYDGGWTVTGAKTMAGPGKADALMNHCSRTEAYYACEQVVNGKPMALMVFTATEDANKFHTQIVLPNGYSTGRGDLTLAGDHWTFLGKDVEGDKTTYFKTENIIKDHDHIHFDQFESADGTTWVKKNEGDEVRTK